MSLRKSSRPSPAIIVAALALVVALGGTAIAAPEFVNDAVTKSKVKKIAKKQAKKQIRKKAPGLSVAHANTADQATNADHATNADKAIDADHATNADNANTATNAQNAQNAQNAVNAQNANNAANLGGVPAASFAQRFFAKVLYNDSTPTILAGSTGVTASGEGALGFPRVTFPRSMNNCALVATTSSGAGTSIVRHSTGTSGTLVQLAVQDAANNPTRVNFSLIGIC